MVDKHRHRRANVKLTQEQVDEIRTRYCAGGVFHKQLAEDYGISSANICLIINNKRWASK
jgi:hypothetical protein